MRKLAIALIAALLVLPVVAPLPAQADPKTEVEGPVGMATLRFDGSFFSTPGVIAGLPIGDMVKVEWEPVVGAKGEIKNETQDTKAECTVIAGTTLAPSNLLRCTVDESDIPGINVGDLLQVTVNFSTQAQTIPIPGFGPGFFTAVQLNANEVCIKNLTTVKGSDLEIEEIEANT